MSVTILKEGARGPEVIDLQYLLIFRSVVTEQELGKVDGVFGPKTKACVLKAQQSKNLVADGIVGSKTWGGLGYVEEWPNHIAGEFLRQGDKGLGVKALQQGLQAQGLYTGAIDGIFGAMTKAAVITIQKAGVRSTNIEGVVGPFTFAATLGVCC